MGYYITLTGSSFTIPREKLDDAYKALCELNKHDELKRGGSWGQLGGGEYGRTEVWFAWMDSDYPSKCKNAEEVFNALRFDTSQTSAGALSLDCFDSKAGDEDYFLDAVTPFVDPGSALEWRGEDGEMWRDLFNGKTRSRQSAVISWRED